MSLCERNCSSLEEVGGTVFLFVKDRLNKNLRLSR